MSNENNYVPRRTAFWRNTEYKLDQLIYDIKADMACNWVNVFDEDTSKKVLAALKEAEILILSRYHDVLEEMIAHLQKEDVTL